MFIDFGFNNNHEKRDRFNGILDLFHVESNIRAPFMERNLMAKLARGLRLHRFRKSEIYKLSDDIFNYSDVKTSHLDMVNRNNQIIKDFFHIILLL